jgi:2-iminobutanoate/2-iminopropanoate deaminase
MAGKRIRSPKVRDSGVPLSHAMRAGDFIFLSGMVARRPEDGVIIDDDVRAATGQCLEHIKNLLAEEKARMDDLVKVTIYLKDFGDFPAVNEVYQTYFSGDPPTRTTIQAGNLGIGLVEIEGIAYTGQ